MKKYRKPVIICAVILVIVAIGSIFYYSKITNETTLSIKEKKWIDENGSTVLSLNIPNDIPVFGNGGEGVFFDFTKYLETDAHLKINNNTISYNSRVSEYGFTVSDSYNEDGLLLYLDHFVLVSKNAGIINGNDVIKTLTVGVLKNDINQVKKYYKFQDANVKGYDNYAQITNDLGNGTITYAIVPLTEYKEEIVKNNINIMYHISDLNKYYYFILGKDKMINSILSKEFTSFKENEYEKSYNKNNYDLFLKNLSITSGEEDVLKSKVYKYGFAEIRPYEIISGSSYGGITAEYIHSFEKFSGVEFEYKKYKFSNDLVTAALNEDIDLYYNYYKDASNYIDVGALYPIDYYVIASNAVDLSLSDIQGLQYKKVYVLENTYLHDLVKNIKGIKINTYKNTTDVKNIIKKDSIIVINANIYDYYLTNMTNDFSVRYEGTIKGRTYSFKYKNNTDTFYKLFNAYTKTLDSKDLLRTGMIEYNRISKRGNALFKIAEYILILLIAVAIIVLVLRRKNKEVKLETKVKKEDRLKYIDMLTSLKNRNYYNEKISIWNKNKIYPQTCVVLDLNDVKGINDKFGHAEGDKQIVSVANILIKTQIDNTEIIRTDGNEFLIYMVGYSEKQVLSYINKLRKMFEKELPYKYDVAVGFSMILDDTKLIEDAFNEASIQMRSNKELNEGKDEKKDKEA